MLWSWASRNRSSEEPVLNYKPHPLGNSRDANPGTRTGPRHEETSLERFYSSKGATDSTAGDPATPWNVSSYPSYHQVPSLSQGTESSQQTASSQGFSDSADKPTRDGERFRDGPRLAASAVFPLRAAATNRFLSKLTSGGRAGEDREVSSGRRERVCFVYSFLCDFLYWRLSSPTICSSADFLYWRLPLPMTSSFVDFLCWTPS